MEHSVLIKSEISPPPARLPVIALFTANAVSSVGTVMTQLALPWFVLQTTGSAAKTGLVSFFVILPTIFAAFLGGTLVDRLGFRRSSILADWFCTLTIALIPLLYAAGRLEFWALLGLVFFTSLFDTPGVTARTALLPVLALKANMTLEQASTGSQVINRVSHLIGAPLAGLLIALLGATQVLWIDASTFAFSALLIMLTVPAVRRHPEKEPLKEKEKTSFWEELREGIIFIWQDRLIRIVIGVVMITNMLDGAIFGVVLPFYAKNFLGQALDLGLLLAANGGGAVVGALIFGAFNQKLPQRYLFVYGLMFASLEFFSLALMPPYWALIGCFVLVGLFVGPINPIIIAVMYARIPEKNLGKTIGVVAGAVNVVTPLGVLIAGFLLDQVNTQALLTVTGILFLGATSVLAFSHSVRQIDNKTGKSI
jgi:MFS family permease